MKNLLCIAAMVLCLASCKKNECNDDGPVVTPIQADRFVFGLSGGFCGVCYNYYEVRDGNIYEDSVYSSGDWLFKSQPLSQSSYNLALPLKNSFPVYLTQHPNSTFGCNGCADQRTFYIETVKEGVKTTWYIDDVTSSIPAAVKPYTDQMRTIIDQLH